MITIAVSGAHPYPYMRAATKGQWINYGFMLSGILLAIWRALPTFSYIISESIKSAIKQRPKAAGDNFYGLFREEAHVIIKSEDEHDAAAAASSR